MPWNNQGGGPWGSPPGGGGGNQNPWGGRGNGGGGGQPPDFEDLLKKGQDRVRRAMPGGFGGGKGLLLIALVALLFWGASGLYRVQPDEQGVVLRFGDWVRTETMPGLHYHLPYPIETVYTPKVTRENRIEIGFQSAGGGQTVVRDVPDESLMLTQDENIIDIDFTVLWRIKDAGQYLFNIRDPEETVKKAAESAMREVIGQLEFSPALNEARQLIEVRTREILQQMLDDYESGVEVTQVQLQKSLPPAQVMDAYNEVLRARQDLDTARNQAETYRNDIIPRARGEAERLRQAAQGYREEVVNRAQGDAQRFMSVYEAYSQSRDVTARRLYLETMEEILRGANKIIVGGENGATQGVLPYLPLNELQRAPAASASAPAATSR